MTPQEVAQKLAEGLQSADPHTAVADLTEDELANALSWLCDEAQDRELTDAEFAALTYAENTLDNGYEDEL